jgi:hypothetical protein
MRKTKTATAKLVKAPTTGRKKLAAKPAKAEVDKVGNMTMTSGGKGEARVYRSDAFEAIHSAASALHSVEVIDKKTMREFDASCFTVLMASN